jgi:hypothetical protein
MEVDWAAEVGPDLPSIDVPWEGFIDLRQATQTGAEQSVSQGVEEAAAHPALRDALVALNSHASPVFTSKCDAWTMPGSEIDRDEFSALAADAQGGFASYIDVLLRDVTNFASFEFHKRWARSLATHLRIPAIPNGRVDFILRTGTVDREPGYGLTLYAAGCGADAARAYAAWQTVLAAAVTATITTEVSPPSPGE